MSAFPSLVCILLVTATGCDEGDVPEQPDALPAISYESFDATTWSLAMVDGRYQLSITDSTGSAACALASDQRNGLGAAGHQLIISLPDATGVPCPNGSYPMNMNCGINLGTSASVPASCAYYRRWDATGMLLGVAGSLNGEITVAGSAGSCSIRANVGFLGGSFAMMTNLTDGQGASPWCN